MINQNELKADDVSGRIVTDGLVQRVNLIKFISRQQKIYLSFNQILQICALVIAIFLGCSLYSYWEHKTINEHITNLRSQYADLVKNIGSDRIKKIQEFTNTDAVYSILQTLFLKNGTGFTDYLEAFSVACPNGVWLTSINIKKRKDNIVLLGKAYRPNNIVQMINNLNRAALFQKTPFFLAKIEKTIEPVTDDSAVLPVIYSFTLQTQATAELKT